MESQPCKVCGGKDLSLVDGYYYCVECGTQDVEARETVVEQTMLADGTFAYTTSKKLTTVLKESIDMSGEWKKWHAYNFILAGLTEELLALGAEPSVKRVVLWIWVKYIKMFQDKEALRNKTQFEDTINETTKTQKEDESDTEDTDNEAKPKSKLRKRKKKGKVKFRYDIKIVTKGTLLTILYIALNLDRSDIQLSHLFRFIKEGRLSIMNCTKFIPKEIHIQSIPQWKNFVVCRKEYTPKRIRQLAMTFFKRLDLGVPIVPNLTKMISDYVKELCLPNDFKNLVLSLMNLMPCEFLKLDTRARNTLVRMPDYEAVCMSYIIVALKMCFGLDCDYEVRLSDEIDRINCKKNLQKSYKIGFYSDASNRLFSFSEWSQFLQFRKLILCKNYLPMAHIYNLPVDDCVFMEQLQERDRKKTRLSDEVTMDILNKITINNDVTVIPKTRFPVTFIPMTTFTEIILEHIQDPDLKLLLSEDFTQYSLKYTIDDLKLPNGTDNSVNFELGVSENNKTFNPFIIGTLESKEGDNTMVFVRNCENKNWLKTKPPTVEHVTKIMEGRKSSDKENDYTSGYDSNSECPSIERVDIKVELEAEKDMETFEEEDQAVNIFDDDFKNMTELYDADYIQDSKEVMNETLHEELSNDMDDMVDIEELRNFDPQTFDRDKVINELIEIACKQYHIPIPKEKQTEPAGSIPRSERKRLLKNNEAYPIEAKKRKLIILESKKESERLIASYYNNVQNDVLNQISANVRSLIQNTTAVENETIIPDPIETRNEDNLENDASAISINIDNTLSIVNEEENETVDDSIVSNPNFDPKTYDIKQLYLKFKDEPNININFEFSDEDIDKLIDKKIIEFPTTQTETVSNLKSGDEASDSEDDIPLSDLIEEKKCYKKQNKNTRLEKLTNNNLTEFNYWMRHYKSRAFVRSNDMTKKFDVELLENCPISFVFVLRECAAILNCTNFCLYKCMQNLEQIMLRYTK